MKERELLQDSAVVAAHPDDEALWFGSVAGEADLRVLCYLEIPSRPDVSEGRRRCLEEYPLPDTLWLGLPESEASPTVRWWLHRTTEYGMDIPSNRDGARRYEANYLRLREILSEKLKGVSNVFTHNPWGEYGHAEHVQVYRAVKSLQEDLGYRIWCSNYCSQKTINFLSVHISACDGSYTELPVDAQLVMKLRDLYLKHRCWTWYENWKWFAHESFVEDSQFFHKDKDTGAKHLFPVNFVNLPDSQSHRILKKAAFRILGINNR